MGVLRVATIRIAAVGTVAFIPLDADGQGRPRSAESRVNDTVSTAVAGQHYGAQGVKRTVFGGGWREVWVAPIAVPSLQLSTYEGGLKVLERGGGYQSITLHLQEEKGWKEHRFRSVNKFPAMTLPPALRETFAGRVIQDQVSALFPGAPLMVPPFLDAVKALHVDPKLYRLADDERLGVYRDTMAGMLGTIELKGDEAPNDEPGFADSKKIDDTDDFFEDLRSKRTHRFDEQEFLAIRLIDLLINDSDRTPNNSDFARFGDSTGYTWRAIARDRDWAFMDARGLVTRFVTRPLYPKTVSFSPTFDMKALTYSTHYLDRRLLQRLTRDDFAVVASKVKAAITDDVIEQAIATLPAEWRDRTDAATRLRSVLRSRREGLPGAAMWLYSELAKDVDVYGTDEDDRAEITRNRDGSITVTIDGEKKEEKTAASSPDASRNDASEEAPAQPYFERRFLPSETKEIRVYLLGGKDHATIRGEAASSIVVRVVGGYGNDVLADSASGGKTHFYDSDGDNKFVTAGGTSVDERPWREPTVSNGMRMWSSWSPDWGREGGLSPAVSYSEGAGLIVGAGYGTKTYGFRRLPYLWSAHAAAFAGTGNGRFALHADADYRRENSPIAFTFAARASQLESFRFYGYGNSSAKIERDVSLVNQKTLAFEPAAVLNLGWRARDKKEGEERSQGSSAAKIRPTVGRIEAGPVVRWFDAQPVADSPLATLAGPGDNSFGHIGLRASFDLDRTDADAVPMRGWRFHTDVLGAPPVWDLDQSFTRTRADASVYLPLLPNRVHLAMRGGAGMASGAFPTQYAATVGGWSTLRGFSFERYSGDASVDGSTELRVPVGTVNLLVRWDAGVFGLADVGRVWMSGESDGSWHKGFGGGVWLSALGRAISVAYAKGDEHRVYLKAGLF